MNWAAFRLSFKTKIVLSTHISSAIKYMTKLLNTMKKMSTDNKEVDCLNQSKTVLHKQPTLDSGNIQNNTISVNNFL